MTTLRSSIFSVFLCTFLAARSGAQAIKYEVIASEPDSTRIASIERNLQKLPGYIVEKINRFGGRLMIFDGLLTDIERWKEYKDNALEDELSLDTAAGVYDPENKVSYSNQNSTIYCTELHEIGHMADHAYGYPSRSRVFRNAIKLDAKKATLVYYFAPSELIRKPNQVWAEGFRDFYCNAEGMRSMEKFYPNILEYFKKFDRSARRK